jgi:hypothetical protein
MAKRRIIADFAPKVAEVLRDADQYHERYYAVKTFGGPSLHFHHRALGLEGSVTPAVRCELIYGVLASWGMHRMGNGGSKMLPFKEFKMSVDATSAQVARARRINPAVMSKADWSVLESIFKSIRVMATGTSIVGNSKVMAHLVPNAVAPVDREYTLKFLFGTGNITNDLHKEWLLFRKIHEEFFYPIANDRKFRNKAEKWVSDQGKRPWDTSVLKVIDNLVIGAMK